MYLLFGIFMHVLLPKSAEFRSFLLNMCMLAPESSTNSLSSSFITDGAGRHHSLEGEKKVALSFSSELVHVFGKVPCLDLGTSLLSFNLLLRPILKFQSVGTTQKRNLDLNFSERRTFVFSDVCMTVRSFCESYS